MSTGFAPRASRRRTTLSWPARFPVTGRRLQQAFASVGGVRGKELAEIVDRAGAPDTSLELADGHRVCHWQSAPGWGRVYAITLLFDASDRCLGVRSEYGG